MDISKSRRETMRWTALLTLNEARPVGAHGALVLSVLRTMFPDATTLELRREMEYLEARDLVEVIADPDGSYAAKLTRDGIDVVEYTVDCEPGIARPPQHWAD
ncbi:MAG TPA: hypothetical protein VNV36_06170 [Pseudomonas sp.]|uniref:hypothetical protein n=1 Tax=Pseudomonas sp. TaxID=306 RepID=UPI002C4204E4|nr:hypothetical protein [Pseudomonas sp.]HWH86341.1 hypothetical protein [Pseudomonas sp.]